jgi:hypothetical protein
MARNYAGEVVRAAVIKVPYSIPVLAEAFGFEWALQVAKSIKVLRIHVEGECLNCVNALLLKPGSSCWVISMLLRNVLSLPKSLNFVFFPGLTGIVIVPFMFLANGLIIILLWLPYPGPLIFYDAVRGMLPSFFLVLFLIV